MVAPREFLKSQEAGMLVAKVEQASLLIAKVEQAALFAQSVVSI